MDDVIGSWLSSPCVMGILNITPDSFSDGGRHLEPDPARERVAQIAHEGAAICDVGAESTRPGAQPVPVDEQLRRLAPVFEAMAADPHIPISIDTSSSVVASQAIDRGAVLVNDVTAGRGDPAMLELVADRGCGICLMHMKGDPRTMQIAPSYDDVVAEVRTFLAERIEAAVRAGVDESAILIDPGIGFGKRLPDNLALLANTDALRSLGPRLVVGVSRKRMFGDLLDRDVDERLPASLAAGLAAIRAGADVLRVHDVRETVDAIRVWAAVEEAAG